MIDASMNVVRDGLTFWAAILRGRSTLRRYDAHKASENLARDFLNRLYGYKLKNLNRDGVETPGIDLGDDDEPGGLCFQVTADDSSTKVHECLASFESRPYAKRFRNLKILLLVDERPRFSKTTFTAPSGVKFDPKKDILDFKQLGLDADDADPSIKTALRKWVQMVGLCHAENGAEELARTVRQRLMIEQNSPIQERQIVFRNTGDINFEDIYVGAYLVCEDEGGPELVLYDQINPSIPANGGEVRWGDLISQTNNRRPTARHEREDLQDYGETLTCRFSTFLAAAKWPIRLVAAFRATGDDRPVLRFWAANRFTNSEDAAWLYVDEANTDLYFRALALSDRSYWYRWNQHINRESPPKPGGILS
jgi:hypothetical protein